MLTDRCGIAEVDRLPMQIIRHPLLIVTGVRRYTRRDVVGRHGPKRASETVVALIREAVWGVITA